MALLEGLSNLPTVRLATVVLVILVLATAIVYLLKPAKSEEALQELKQRVLSWWVMGGTFFACALLHPTAVLIFFGMTSFLALKEYFTLIQPRLEDHRTLLWSYLAIPVQYWWVHCQWEPLFFIFIPVYMFLFIPFRLLLVGKTDNIVTSMAKIQWGLMAFVFCISHVAALFKFESTSFIPGGGLTLIVFLVFLTEMNDIAQYMWGKMLGKHKITPTISPNKTWEGFIGGLVTTTLLAWGMSYLIEFPHGYAAVAGALIASSGFVGDLVISAVKRDIGVKDASSLIPGHGGVLDRIDSLTYTAPLFFHFVNYFLYPLPR